MLQDPEFQSEKDFQDEVITQVKRRLERHAQEGLTFGAVESFGLDLGVFLLLGRQAMCRFVELKAYKGHRAGGVGFGSRQGYGPQVDFLMLPDPLIEGLGSTVRWCVADLTKWCIQQVDYTSWENQATSSMEGGPWHFGCVR